MIPWIGLVRCERSVPMLLSARRSTSICCPSSIWQHASMPRTGNAAGAASALPLLTADPVWPLLLLGWICMDQIQPPRFRSSTPWLGRAATSPRPSTSPKPAWSRLVRSGLLLVCPARIMFEASVVPVCHTLAELEGTGLLLFVSCALAPPKSWVTLLRLIDLTSLISLPLPR